MNMMVTYEEPSSVSAKHTPGAVLNMGSVSKESACNAEDPSSIPGLGRSAGKGIGNPLQYLGASLVAQLVKNTQKSSMKNILMIQIPTMVLLLT